MSMAGWRAFGRLWSLDIFSFGPTGQKSIAQGCARNDRSAQTFNTKSEQPNLLLPQQVEALRMVGREEVGEPVEAAAQ